jgi:hypothetical protein
VEEIMKYLSALVGSALLLVSGCGSDLDVRTGTLVFTANGEDFVREGFVSEDGWSIRFESVFANVYGPTAYQVVEEAASFPGLRHGGHPHEDVPEGSAHVALLGEYFLDLKQDVFEVGRVKDAPIGNYNRVNFNVQPATADAADLPGAYQGASIVMDGTATRDTESVAFLIRLDEEMRYVACGPNGDAGVLPEDGIAHAEMTFHFDHIFGDLEEGPPDPDDEDTVNHIAIGFGPFAELAEDGALEIDQAELGKRMVGATYLQLIEAVRTLGHCGEAHCHLEE